MTYLASPALSQETNDTNEQLIEQLRSEKHTVRNRARLLLIKRDTEAVSALKKYFDDEDTEVRYTVRQIIGRVRDVPGLSEVGAIWRLPSELRWPEQGYERDIAEEYYRDVQRTDEEIRQKQGYPKNWGKPQRSLDFETGRRAAINLIGDWREQGMSLEEAQRIIEAMDGYHGYQVMPNDYGTDEEQTIQFAGPIMTNRVINNGYTEIRYWNPEPQEIPLEVGFLFGR